MDMPRRSGAGLSMDIDEKNANSPTGDVEAFMGVMIRRRPFPRKGHTKSRAGCLICKQRKVKCDEEPGMCGQCLRLGLPCQYLSPDLIASEAMSSSSTLAASPARPLHTLHTNPATLEMDDLLFFQHFLFSAYPSLPADGWSVWQKASQMAHQYEFLAHAMLGLGASHLGMLNGQAYTQKALKHRVRAIKALNERLSENLSKADADATFSAMLSLTWQSAYMEDGMVDFFSMVRGCFIVGHGVLGDWSGSLFENLSRLDYIGRLKEISSRDQADQVLNRAVAARLCASLESLAPLCKSVAELDYLARMQCITALSTSDLMAAYTEHSYIYERLSEFSAEEFSSLMNPDNHVSQLILMHVLALDLVMTRKEFGKNVGNGIAPRRRSMSMVWTSAIYKNLPEEFRRYAAWLVEFQEGISITFSKADEIWTPFLLHEGMLTAEDIYSAELTT